MRVRVRACVRMCICRCLGLFLVRDFSCIHAGHAVPGSRSRSLALLPFACLLGSLALPVLACLRICSFCAFLFLCCCLRLCLCRFSRACVWVVAFVRVCVRACARRHWLEVSKSPAATQGVGKRSCQLRGRPWTTITLALGASEPGTATRRRRGRGLWK